MISQTKQVSLILIIAVMLTSFFSGIVYAQCPGTRIYFNDTTGNDQTGDGKSDGPPAEGTPFKTFARALEAADACPGQTVSIYKNNAFYRRVTIDVMAEASGSPIADTLLISGLVVAAIILIGSALLLRRRPIAATS